MSKAVFVLGSLELEAVKVGAPLTPRTNELLAHLRDIAGLDAIEIIFATQDEFLAGKNKKDIGIDHLREERPRVLTEIQTAAPDFVVCFGPVAAACVFDHGSLTENFLLRREHFPLSPELPVYYTFGMENVWRAPGLRQWLELDIKAAVDGHTETVWGNYMILLPGMKEWDAVPWNFGIRPQYQYNKHNKIVPELVGFDTETYPGLQYYRPEARLRMIQISDQEGRAWVVQLTPDSQMPTWVKDLAEDPNILKVGSNISFDYHWMRRFGVRMRNFEDTSIREHIIDQSNPKTNLKSLSFKYLPRLGDYARGHLELVAQRAKEHKVKKDDGWQYVRDDEQYNYAGGDAEASIATWRGQEKALFVLGAPRELSKALNETLAEVEFNGICVDLEKNTELDRLYGEHLAGLRAEITPVLGPVNLNSPIQLARALIAAVPDINLRPKKLARLLGADEDEAVSTDRETLEREHAKHPIIAKVLEYRKYRVRHSTFIKLDKHLVQHHGKYFIHPNYRLDVAETFRSASRDPNMQNIPTIDYEHPELSVKRQFVSRWDGGSILDIDQSQLELRFAAWLSHDHAMIEAIESGADIHTRMTATMLRKNEKNVTEQERHECKTRTFLMLYGGGAKALAESLGIDKQSAQKMIDDYFVTFSGLDAFIKASHKKVRRTLVTESVFGFRRHYLKPTNWRSSEGLRILRQDFNFQVQGPAFQLMGCALIEMQAELEHRRLRSKLVLQVHDNAVFDVYPDELEEVRELAINAMEFICLDRAQQYGVNFTLPLRADVKVGPTWGDVQ